MSVSLYAGGYKNWMWLRVYSIYQTESEVCTCLHFNRIDILHIGSRC